MKEKLTPSQIRVVGAIKYLSNYMSTYAKQPGYENYSDEVIIDDVLYGLGTALDNKKYRFAAGFDRFKEVLKKHLK